jgi:hypothetical protein
MRKQIIFIFLCLFCCGACKSKYATKMPIDELVIIDVDKALHAHGELRLSDFVDSISFTPIYDGDTAFIGNALIMEITENHLWVYDDLLRLVCYNFKDRKSRYIGMRGRGPGEYLNLSGIAADERTKTIYATSLLSGKSAILKYDFEGRFLGSISLENDADAIELTDNGNIVVHLTNYSGNSKSQYLVMDGEGKIVNGYSNPFTYKLSSQRHSWFRESAQYRYDGKLHIKDKSDTLYVFHEGKRYPKYVFKNSFSIDDKQSLSQADYDDAFVFNYAFETETKLVFNGKLGGTEYDKWHFFYYDKTTGQAYSIGQTIPNDMTDGYPKSFSQSTYDTTFGDCYVKIISNTYSTMSGFPQDEKASYFLMFYHLK